jgi:hypothetical protein
MRVKGDSYGINDRARPCGIFPQELRHRFTCWMGERGWTPSHNRMVGIDFFSTKIALPH